MPRFKHSFWRYIPSTDERQSFFKFVESFETDSDAVPKFDDHNCIDHIKIEFDEFIEPKQKRYTQEEFQFLLATIEKRFERQKEWAKDGLKIPSQYEDGTQVFKSSEELRAFSFGRRAYFLHHLVRNHDFTHLIRRLNIGYTGQC